LISNNIGADAYILPITTSVGAGGGSRGFLRFLENCAFTLKKVCIPCLMLVLGARDTSGGALVVSRGERDDNAALLNCLERVIYAKVFLQQ
jgi:hypothetical protein